MEREAVVVGVSGASGAPLAVRTLEVLRSLGAYDTHLVATEGARLTAEYELEQGFSALESLADHVHSPHDIGACVASGTFETRGMVVVPCSMKTVAGIASGYSDNLLLRAADVCVKEKRPLVLAAREAPLSPIHLRNMEYLATLPNVTVCPPVLTYYIQPATLEAMELHLVAKMLSPLGIRVPGFQRWEGKPPRA